VLKIACSLAWAALFALPIATSSGAEPCHEGHCHERKICGGGWKDHRVPVQKSGPSGGASTGAEACASLIAEIEKETKDQAATKCAELHPCGQCPERCSGCESINPVGRVATKDARRNAKRGSDGRWQCEVTVPTTYRCRCSACLVKTHTAGDSP